MKIIKMHPAFLIESCINCDFLHMKMDRHLICEHPKTPASDDYELGYYDEDSPDAMIPVWCPLDDAPEEE